MHFQVRSAEAMTLRRSDRWSLRGLTAFARRSGMPDSVPLDSATCAAFSCRMWWH